MAPSPEIPTAAALCDAMCDLAVSFSEPAFQRRIERLFSSQPVSFWQDYRSLLLTCQTPVLRRLGYPATSEGAALLDATVMDCVTKEEQSDLLQMANGALKLVRMPPMALKKKRRKQAGIPNAPIPAPLDPLEILHNCGTRRDFWRGLCPWLHVAGPSHARAEPPCKVISDSRVTTGLAADLEHFGYCKSPDGVSEWAVDLAGLARGIAVLVDRGLPAAFVLVYDEAWALAAQLEPLVHEITGGSELVMDWSIFHAPKKKRGQTNTTVAAPPRRRGDIQPHGVTFWVALTEASSEGSCLTVVPRPRDPGFDALEENEAEHDIANVASEDWDALRAAFCLPTDFQYIRALTLPAGGLVAFSHRLLHWLSVPDPQAEPTTAIAFTARQPGRGGGLGHCFRKPDAVLPMPPPGARLAVAAAQVLLDASLPGAMFDVSSVESLELLLELFNSHAAPLQPDFCKNITEHGRRLYEQLSEPTAGREAGEAGLFDNVKPPSKAESKSTPTSEIKPAEQNEEEEEEEVDDAEFITDFEELLLSSSSVNPLHLVRCGGEHKKFWQKLCPWLHVESVDLRAAAMQYNCPYTHDDEFQTRARACARDLDHKGYFRMAPGDGLPWAIDLAAVARGMLTLVERGIPPVFIFAYDEVWLMMAQLQQLVSASTGGLQNTFDVAAFCVRAMTEACTSEKAEHSSMSPAGWPPHRDRGSNAAAANGFRVEDGAPRYVTFWVPLTDATPESSCLHVVPRPHDPGYRAGDGKVSCIYNIFRKPEHFCNIRALPVSAGGLLAFSHRLFHWGSAADPRAEAPRIAIAFAAAEPSFERSCWREPMETPLPPLGDRVALAAAQVLTYFNNEDILTEVSHTRAMWELFWQNSMPFDQKFVDSVSTANVLHSERLNHTI